MRGSTAKSIRESVMGHKEFVECKRHPKLTVDEGWRMHPGPFVVRVDTITSYRQAKQIYRRKKSGL